jgi:hypothetical protein
VDGISTRPLDGEGGNPQTVHAVLSRAAELGNRLGLSIICSGHDFQKLQAVVPAKTEGNVPRSTGIAQCIPQSEGTLQKSNQTRINFTGHRPSFRLHV